MAGLIEKLFNKSGDELDKIEGQGLAAPAGETPNISDDAVMLYNEAMERYKEDPYMGTGYLKQQMQDEKYSDEDRAYLQEQYDYLLEKQYEAEYGKKTSQRKGAEGLSQPTEDPEMLAAFEGGANSHPGFKVFEADQSASPEEEEQLKALVVPAMRTIYDEANLPAFVKVLNPDGKEFFEAAGETAYLVTMRQYQKEKEAGRSPNPSVFFGRGGMLETMVDQMFEIGQNFDLMGADDRDQYAGAMGFAWQKAGEYIMESGDEASIAEAQEMMMDMALTRDDGTMIETRQEADQVRAASMQQKQLAQGVQQGLQQAIAPKGVPS